MHVRVCDVNAMGCSLSLGRTCAITAPMPYAEASHRRPSGLALLSEEVSFSLARLKLLWHSFDHFHLISLCRRLLSGLRIVAAFGMNLP